MNDEGEPVRISSEDVNEYLQEITGEEFTAKDFRTWNGTRESAKVLDAMGPAESQPAAKKNIVEAVKQTAKRLGNRPAMCRKYYIHPAVLDSYTDGTLFDVMSQAQPQDAQFGLAREEMAVMQLLARHKPEPLRAIEQDRDLTKALGKSLKRAGAVDEVEIEMPSTAVA